MWTTKLIQYNQTYYIYLVESAIEWSYVALLLLSSAVACINFLTSSEAILVQPWRFFQESLCCMQSRFAACSYLVIWLMSTWPGISYIEEWFSDTLFVGVISVVLCSLVRRVQWFDSHNLISIRLELRYAIYSLVCVGFTIGIGLFKAKSIQFGLGRLLEAPTPKLHDLLHPLVLLESEC